MSKITSPFNNPISFASCSIGLPRHTLEDKLAALSAAGFNGIELSFPDLRTYATQHLNKGEIAADDYHSLCEAGKLIHELCAELNLQIMVGSSDSPDITSSIGDLVADLAELADLLATRGFKIAYENWCWATHMPSWKDVWKIVQLANRPNLGLCLDTFQSAGGEWGDPTTESGRIETGGVSEQDLKMSYEISLQELAKTVPPEKIYFLQISDAYKVSPPLGKEPDESGLRPRGRWSHDHRPLPFDGGYLPILQFLEAVMSTGFRGWLSVEVFDGKFEEKYGDDLSGYAKKGRDGVVKMLGEMIVDGSGL
ncbi:xylose isomerase-like TIM barrel [Colletotrichum filicis]|nr:xylose isomerase-like TIM barrel [Colletotrichum filicis]